MEKDGARGQRSSANHDRFLYEFLKGWQIAKLFFIHFSLG